MEWFLTWKKLLGTAVGVVVIFTARYKKALASPYTDANEEAPLFQQAMAIRARKEEDPLFKVYVVTSSDADHGSESNPSALYLNLFESAPDFGPCTEWNAFVEKLAKASPPLPPPSSASTGEQAVENYVEGQRWMNGYGHVEINEAKAASCYQLSAHAGYAPAAAMLGICYINGRGVDQNDAAGQRWCKKAVEAMGLLEMAEQGAAAAQLALGILFVHGAGEVDEDEEEAVAWYMKGAAQEDADAQCKLGLMYYTGDGVEDEDGTYTRCTYTSHYSHTRQNTHPHPLVLYVHSLTLTHTHSHSLLLTHTPHSHIHTPTPHQRRRQRGYTRKPQSRGMQTHSANSLRCTRMGRVWVRTRERRQSGTRKEQSRGMQRHSTD
jgi:TPR repeat protein